MKRARAAPATGGCRSSCKSCSDEEESLCFYTTPFLLAPSIPAPHRDRSSSSSSSTASSAAAANAAAGALLCLSSCPSLLPTTAMPGAQDENPLSR